MDPESLATLQHSLPILFLEDDVDSVHGAQWSDRKAKKKKMAAHPVPLSKGLRMMDTERRRDQGAVTTGLPRPRDGRLLIWKEVLTLLLQQPGDILVANTTCAIVTVTVLEARAQEAQEDTARGGAGYGDGRGCSTTLC